eukprot:scaffold118985_cov14-Tisochrysis_lutea.AAC.1
MPGQAIASSALLLPGSTATIPIIPSDSSGSSAEGPPPPPDRFDIGRPPAVPPDRISHASSCGGGAHPPLPPGTPSHH